MYLFSVSSKIIWRQNPPFVRLFLVVKLTNCFSILHDPLILTKFRNATMVQTRRGHAAANSEENENGEGATMGNTNRRVTRSNNSGKKHSAGFFIFMF